MTPEEKVATALGLLESLMVELRAYAETCTDTASLALIAHCEHTFEQLKKFKLGEAQMLSCVEEMRTTVRKLKARFDKEAA